MIFLSPLALFLRLLLTVMEDTDFNQKACWQEVARAKAVLQDGSKDDLEVRDS